MGKKNILDNATKIQNERDFELKRNLLIPCATKKHLNLWFKFYLDVDLADCTVSRFATTNPMDAAWEIYKHALYNETDNPLNILLIAARASQKTLSMAAVELAIMLHDRRDILHYAAAESQSKVGWAYLIKFAQRPFVRDLLETKPTNDSVIFNIPNYLNESEEPKQVTGKVLSITLLNAQGQHAPFVSVDELLTLAHDKRKAYYDLSGVPVSTNTGKPYIRAEISSRKGPYSVVEEKVAQKDKTGLLVKTWTVFENQKRCPDERSGTKPIVFYGNPEKALTLTVEQYEQLTDVEKKSFYRAHGFDKCLECKISSFCLGDAKKQISKCKILNPVEKTITDYHNTSLDLWFSQRMSMKPSPEGLVFPTFSIEKHVKNLKQIWEIYLGHEINSPLPLNKLIEKMKQDRCMFYCGIDHSGGTSPYAIVTVAVDSKGRVFVLNVFGKVVEFDLMTRELQKFNNFYDYRCIYPDPASRDKNDLLKKLKFRIKDQFTKQISAGIELIRTKLMAADGTISCYLLDESTAFMQDEFTKYHFRERSDGTYADEPEDDHNHSLDALRYIFQNIFIHRNGEWMISVDSSNLNEMNEFNKQEKEIVDYWFKNHVNNLLEDRGLSSSGNSEDSVDGYVFLDI